MVKTILQGGPVQWGWITGSIKLPSSGMQTGNISLNGSLSGHGIANAVLPRGSVTVRDQGQRMYHKGAHQFWGVEDAPTTSGDHSTTANVLVENGVIYVRGDASNVPRIRFTTGPSNETVLADIVPVHETGNMHIVVGTQAFILGADGTLNLPALTADPATAMDGSIWNVGGVLRKRVGGANSNVG